MLDETALCDEILRTSGDSIAQASGLYINGKFEGSVDSRSELDGMLNGILQSYITADGQRASFVQSAEVVDGLYPISSLVTTEDLKARLTSPAVVEKAVEVQAGGHPGRHRPRQPHDPGRAAGTQSRVRNTDMVSIGQSLVVQPGAALSGRYRSPRPSRIPRPLPSPPRRCRTRPSTWGMRRSRRRGKTACGR